MSDSGKTATFKDATVEVGKDTANFLKDTLKAGAGAFGVPHTPSPIVNGEKGTQQKLARTRLWLRNTAANQERARQENEQKDKQRIQQQTEALQDAPVEEIPQFGTVPSTTLRSDIAETRPELRAGRKGG